MIILWYILLSVTTAICQKYTPDITLLSTVINNTVSHTCVAGSNIEDSAITFITPFGSTYTDNTPAEPTFIESNYVFNGTKYEKDEYDCDFEPENQRSSEWTDWGTVESGESGTYIQELVLDERWEKLPTFSHETNPIKHDLNSENINIGVSVRTGGIASVLLCNEGSPMQCYWIKLNYEKMLLKLSYCPAVNYTRTDKFQEKNKFKEENFGCQNISLKKGLNVTLSEKNWNHFVISKFPNEYMDTLQLCDNRKKIGCMEYSVPNTFAIKTMYLHLEKKGFWKIHKYNYLSLNQETINGDWHEIGPELHPDHGVLCVALYAMCEACTLSFKFSLKDTEVSQISEKHWKYIKLIVPNAGISTYKLQVKAWNSTRSTGFLFIDDVRRCHINETRIIKTSAPMSDRDTVSCVALKRPSWSSSNIAGKVGTAVNEICKNSTNIGSNCNISCSSVLGKDIYCNKYIICKPTNKPTEPKCSCAAGYHGEQCTEPCPEGFYGYNCLTACEPCQGYCTKSSGVCPIGNTCISDDEAEGCNLAGLLKLLAPPEIINSTLTTISLKPKIKSVMGNTDVQYQIEYKCSSMRDWKTYGDKTLVSELKETILTNLKPMTEYKIRVVLYKNGGHNTKLTDHIFKSVTTTCTNISADVYYDNLKINQSSRFVTITWTPICSGKIQFTATPGKQNSFACSVPVSLSESINITDEKYVITNLIPSTEYNIQIEAKNDILVDQNTSTQSQTFSTAESEFPTLRSRPDIISITLTTITIKFDREDIIKEEIAQKFKVQYRKISNQYKSKWESTAKYNVEINNEFKLNNLAMDTKHEIRVVFYTATGGFYDVCIPTATATTTCTDLSNLQLIQDLNVEPSTRQATVSWTPVCRNQFEIHITCHNPWCSNKRKPIPIKSITKKHVISDLIPFTNYTIKFRVNNQINNEMNETTFQTKPAAPPRVTELQVYSFDTAVISIRFKKPYPPHGELLYYEYQFKDCNSGYAITKNNTSFDCTLWDGFQCIETAGKFEKTCYNIFIEAINIDEPHNERGINYSEITVENRETEPPRNININVTEKEIQLCWEHPNFTRGTLKGFQITIKQIETILIAKKKFYDFESSINTSPQRKYCHKINQKLQFSSKYNISVQGKNKNEKLGEPATEMIFYFPIQPMLEGNITADEYGRTNNTQKITIPPFKNATLTKSSTVYIVVCDPTSNHGQIEKEILKDLEDKLRPQSGCPQEGLFWITAKLNVTATEFTEFTVEALKPDIIYTISVLLVNEYYNKSSFERYSIITSAPVPPPGPSPGLYALFLLLLIVPAVGFFAYKRFQKPESLPQPGTSFEVSGQNNNVPMRNFFNNISRNVPNRKSEDLQTENEQPLINEQSLINEPTYTTLVKIGNLSQYVKESLENGELERQHALFPKGGTKPWEYGMIKENKFKNRYNNLTAYDHSRVVLKKIHGDPFSDFINANYIDGYKKPQAYIATQGPKPSTLNDFWRMIWQENVKYIVMLANLVEGNKPKCEQYWPELGSTQEYYNISVTFMHTDIYADFEYRSFEATCEGQSRKIQHLHFTSWPDHGVPQYPQSLVPFLRKILTIPTTAPIVVHCSAGVGRTGTIILADICLRMAAVEGQVDVLKYMHSIREQRAKLVDNFDQYKLVHMLLLECLLAPETSLPCENLARAFDELVQQGGLQKQIAYLRDTAWHCQVLKSPIRIETENVSKNRFPEIVPSVRRIYISRYPYEDEFSDYINAVPVDGFRTKDQFIVTQTPLPHTVKDFWRMIFENNVKVIVSLNEIIINDKSCCLFWPLESGQYKPVPYLTLNYISINEGPTYDTYNIQLINTFENSTSNVSIIQYKNWKREQVVPDDVDTLIRVLEEAQNLSRQGDPSVIACYDGASASGLFVALSFIIEKMKLEQICDVCQAVRAVRINRSQFVSHRKQFEFLYQAAVTYVASFDDYSNFEGPRKI